TLLIGVFIQPEFKGVEALIRRAVNTTAIRNAPLLHRVFVESDGCTGEEIRIIPGESRIIGNIGTIPLVAFRVTGSIGVFYAKTCLDHKSFKGPVIVYISSIDV